MTYEHFVKQLDGCTYLVDGKPSGGFNCNCASEAMRLYRATQGRIATTSCAIRRKTGDQKGGTNLDQMVKIDAFYGVTGTLYKPGRFSHLKSLIQSGRYGAIVQVGYSQIAGSVHDCFRNEFRGGHSFYVSRDVGGKARYGDPGADGRYAGCPSGWQTIEWDWLERAAAALPLVVDPDTGRIIQTLSQEYGSGYVYALLTPADPLVPTQKYVVQIAGTTGNPDTYTPLYAAPNGQKVGAVSVATYLCVRSKVGGLWWYRILSKADGSHTDNAGRYFKPNRYTTARLP